MSRVSLLIGSISRCNPQFRGTLTLFFVQLLSQPQALFFVGLRESLVGLAVPCRQKQVNGFSKFPCDIVLNLGVRAA